MACSAPILAGAGAFRTDEVNFLQAVANVLGSAIERHRAEAQLWRVNQAQRVLSKCNEALIRATEESALLQQICDLIVEEAGYRFCWVGRAENDAASRSGPSHRRASKRAIWPL